MAERAERVEQYAQKLWSLRTVGDSWRYAEQCGYQKSELNWLEWGNLPERVGDYVRDEAERESRSCRHFRHPAKPSSIDGDWIPD